MNELQVLRTTITAGLERPVKLLHVTDTHITRDDPTGKNRTAVFDKNYPGCKEEYFFQALRYARENNLPIIHTGDMLDFFSPGNFDFLDRYLADVDYIYAVGNHDFGSYASKSEETLEYKWENMNEIAPHIKNNLYFYSRIIGGLNIITLDNSYFRITDGQIDLLKAEAAKGYPILLCVHVPFYSPLLSQASHKPFASVIAAPQQLLDTYSEERRLQQTPDEATLRAVEYIKSEPLIKGILAGHKHLNHEEALDNGVMQYVTHGTFCGYVREITVY